MFAWWPFFHRKRRQRYPGEIDAKADIDIYSNPVYVAFSSNLPEVHEMEEKNDADSSETTPLQAEMTQADQCDDETLEDSDTITNNHTTFFTAPPTNDLDKS